MALLFARPASSWAVAVVVTWSSAPRSRRSSQLRRRPPAPRGRLGARPLTPERQWTRVEPDRHVCRGPDLLVRNRHARADVGFEVLTPFTDGRPGASSSTEAGCPAADAERRRRQPDPPRPAGGVTGWLRIGELPLGRDLPPPQLASISIADCPRSSVPSSPASTSSSCSGRVPAVADRGPRRCGPARGRRRTSARTRPTRSSGGFHARGPGLHRPGDAS